MRLSVVQSVVLCMLFAAGCATPTHLYVRNTIPSEMQQNIRVARSQSEPVSFAFNPHPDGELVEVNLSSFKNYYQINEPLKRLMSELVSTKFGQINSSGADKITITVEDVRAETRGTRHILDMTVNVATMKGGQANQRSFTYSTAVESEVTGGGFATKFALTEEPINDLLMKFVVSADKFIDTSFGVQ